MLRLGPDSETPMPFPWMRNPVVHDPAGFRQSHARELRQRAGLLRRLGYAPDAVVARLTENLAWEFDLSGPAPFDEAGVRALVQAVFDR